MTKHEERPVKEQNTHIKKQNIQIENMIQSLLHARKRYLKFYKLRKGMHYGAFTWYLP